ncbi:MAG: PilZ domain-containing protein [Proteobacteria bacterium]|nr:PilZ domain-containing protein [Pseudomonadota bacterium]
MSRPKRRSHTRYACSLPVQIDAGEQTLRGVLLNVSLGGAFVDVVEKPAFGSEVLLRVKLPALREDALLPAFVRWRKETGIGVQFHSLRARAVWALNRLCRQLEPVDPQAPGT